ncbi:MAG TPA: serine/threonine-protein kinase, partial [Nannocystaceae bacterium]|nr:serine/threonine-protein kinase [Nannocystaceae bacterium]
MSRVTEGGAPTELDVARAGQGTSGSARGEPRIVQVGDSVGRYRIEAKVGQGGHGAIYRGRDPALDRVVAIKLLRVADHPLARERLQREARALAQLEHPDVVRVFDVGEHDGAPFIAMEFLDGEDLAQAWKDWPLEARIDALIAAGRGLCATHRAGLVHRDFKPLNVLCCKDGRVVLVDFGLVRELDDVGSTPRVADPRFQTDPRAAIGTRGYMAPEQMVRPDVDARADQFAFAAALYEAAYGETAFGSDGMAQFDVIAMRRRARASHKTGAPRWLRAIIARGLDPDEAARFPDMDALVAALERGRGARRRRLRLAALAVAAGVVVGFGAVAHERSDAAAPREPSVDTANDERAEAERLDRQLAIIDADQHGSLARRLAALDAALVQADSPLLRRALELRHAALLELADDRVGAREELQRLLDDARTAGDHRHTALAHVRLAQTSIDARELAAAELELRNGESAATRANMPVEWDAEVERAAGALAFAHGEYTASEREHWAALDLVQGTPRESAMTTMIGNALGAIAGNRGDFELAADYFVRARAATPDDDPKVPELELNLGGALLGLRREQEA